MSKTEPYRQSKRWYINLELTSHELQHYIYPKYVMMYQLSCSLVFHVSTTCMKGWKISEFIYPSSRVKIATLYGKYGALITSPFWFKSSASGCEGCARGSRRVSLEVKNCEDDRQALVVHAGYKSRMTTGVGQPPKLRWARGWSPRRKAISTVVNTGKRVWYYRTIYVMKKCSIVRWPLDSQKIKWRGRFEDYTLQYRGRSLLSKALNNQMIVLVLLYHMGIL